MEKNKFILLYRIFFTVLSWFTIFLFLFIGIFTYGSIIPWVISLKYYTLQSNILVTVWFSLAIIWHNKPEKLEKLMGNVKGAFTLYITVTFLVFAVVLAPLYHPTGLAAFSNIVLHYITPIAFIVDFLLTETKIKYQWKSFVYWFIYPLCYLAFAIIHGIFTGDYLYPFLNIDFLGFPFFIMSLCILILFFIGLGSIFVVINRKKD